MTTAIDTNVFADLWSGASELSAPARMALERASSRGALVIAPAVYAELIALPRRDPAAVDRFLRDTRIGIDWNLDEAVWRTAALAYRGYSERRRRDRGSSQPRRILADFIIGAHALHIATALLTSDRNIYQAAFPSLTIVVPGAAG